MTDGPGPTLVSITALARSGADGLAWRLFEQAGFHAISDDPAVLALRGRLLKDRALALAGRERADAAREAAAAYAAAGRLRNATYPLINAATLSLVAGDAALARDRAREVIALLLSGEEEPDTPYYRAATRAEALLLLGDQADAARALREAIAIAPRAWEDHASTLRQFATILRTLGDDAAWLDGFRPPRALHYAGQIRISNEAALAASVDAMLAHENIGFGFGALAAGADLLIAERLLAHGAELHVTLPAGRAAFRRASVEPYASDPGRFDRVLAQAATVRELDEVPDGARPAYTLASEMADEVAMGCAAMHAALLQTEALQLVAGQAADGMPAAANSARIARIWAGPGRRQHILDTGCPPMGGERERPADAAVTIAVALSLVDPHERCAAGELAERFAKLPAPLGLVAPPSWRSDGVVLHYGSATEAIADAARFRAIIAGWGGRIAGDLGVSRITAAPFGEAALVLGPAVARVERLLAMTPPTAFYLSEYCACAFAAATDPDSVGGLELVGELADSGPEQRLSLYAVRGR